MGNVRTALINWLFAKGQGGTFILRIDDTDTERSTPEYEQGIKDDLSWLGLVWDDTFNQSDRFANYDAAVEKLKAEGLLYPCFETPDELERKRKIALSRGRPPVYDRAALSLSDDERAQFEAEGRKPHWRFKLSGNRVEWTDLVRGPQSIDTQSISDPILIREDGSYLYTLPSVVDDIDYKITHVVRGEDHVTNSGAQIEIFRALGGAAPDMAHTPLLIGADGQGLSKRLGSLSIEQLKTDGIESMPIASLLAKLGTSDNVALRADLATLAEEFAFSKIGRAPARFDENDLTKLNANLVSEMDFEVVSVRFSAELAEHGQEGLSSLWSLVRENLGKADDFREWITIAFDDVNTSVSDDDKPYIADAIACLHDGDVTAETWSAWTGELKTRTGRKGKSLFMPLRQAITGRSHGPDMGQFITILGREKLEERLMSAVS